MGTNYYYHENPPCEHCGRKDDPKHIGKSSAGWCFSLKVYPEDGINTLDDWKAKFAAGGLILDEYNEVTPTGEMLMIITKRGWGKQNRGELMTPEYLRSNYAEEGPNGLMRHQVDGRHCVSHGEGTWDYMIGEFS